MFYVEAIAKSSKPSLFERIIKAFERVGQLRAAAELERLGYLKEAMRVRRQIEKL